MLASRDPFWDAYLLVSVGWCLAIALGLVDGATDGHSWYVHRLPNPYDLTDYASGMGFYFAPPVAFAIYPLTLLSWPIFAAAWTGISFAALGLMAGRWSALALLFPPVWYEIHAANVNLLIGAAVVLGFRYPSAWAIPLLTKITPGVGLLWFAVRREWQSVLQAAVATGAVALCTMVVAPGLWFSWAHSLLLNAGSNGPGYFTVPVALPVRLAVAVGLVGWGGLTNRPWTVIVAATLGAPVLWFNALAPLVGLIALTSDRRRSLPSPEGSRSAAREMA